MDHPIFDLEEDAVITESEHNRALLKDLLKKEREKIDLSEDLFEESDLPDDNSSD